VATSSSNKEATKLYKLGATFVEQSSFITAKSLRALLQEESGVRGGGAGEGKALYPTPIKALLRGP